MHRAGLDIHMCCLVMMVLLHGAVAYDYVGQAFLSVLQSLCLPMCLCCIAVAYVLAVSFEFCGMHVIQT